MRPGQQDLRGGERAEAVLGGDQAGGHVLDDRGDLGFQAGGGLGQGGDPLAQADQGLVDDAGQPVGAGGAGQLRAGPGAALGREVPELVAQRGRGGDQD